MKLHYCNWLGRPNFGDDLNPWLWRRLLPGAFDEEGEALFVGIGTLLNERLPRADRTVVFGSGAGHGQQPPAVDKTWTIYCLRGPLSAKSLGVSPRLAVTDAAILVRQLIKPQSNRPRKVAFMPHVYNGNQAWRKACELAGIGYIDPCEPVDKVLQEIGETECLLAEAMHGAIIADALRVPWIAIRTSQQISSFKWTDWCLSLNLSYQPYVFPSWLTPLWSEPGSGVHGRLRYWTKIRLASSHLSWIARTGRPRLSETTTIQQRTTELGDQLKRFRRDMAAGRFA